MRWLLILLACGGCYMPGRRLAIEVQAAAPFHSVRCSLCWEDEGDGKD